MIPGPIEKADLDSLQALIANSVSESKTIEYKRAMPGKADSDVVPLIAAVSSFANTDGGDLLIGVEANKGMPVELPGLEIENLDEEKLRIENMLLHGVDPRLPPVDIHPIKTEEDRYVLIIRVPHSWTAPHRVINNKNFYVRNSSGRQELDVGELRIAFTRSEAIADRIRAFRTERMGRLQSNRTPVALAPGGRMVLHILPLASFSAITAIDMTALEAHGYKILPMGSTGGRNHRVNLDGVVTFTTYQKQGPVYGYTQVFRTGAIESVDILETTENDQVLLESTAYEKDVIDILRQYLNVAPELDLEPPFYVFLTFVDVKRCVLVSSGRSPLRVLEWLDDTLVLPEVVIEDRADQLEKVLKPLFDTVWNAFGFNRSSNYDAEGNWVGVSLRGPI